MSLELNFLPVIFLIPGSPPSVFVKLYSPSALYVFLNSKLFPVGVATIVASPPSSDDVTAIDTFFSLWSKVIPLYTQFSSLSLTAPSNGSLPYSPSLVGWISVITYSYALSISLVVNSISLNAMLPSTVEALTVPTSEIFAGIGAPSVKALILNLNSLANSSSPLFSRVLWPDKFTEALVAL